jgi:hypothetical protein
VAYESAGLVKEILDARMPPLLACLLKSVTSSINALGDRVGERFVAGPGVIHETAASQLSPRLLARLSHRIGMAENGRRKRDDALAVALAAGQTLRDAATTAATQAFKADHPFVFVDKRATGFHRADQKSSESGRASARLLPC